MDIEYKHEEKLSNVEEMVYMLKTLEFYAQRIMQLSESIVVKSYRK